MNASLPNTPVCPKCGRKLDAYAPEGECPRCMLLGAVADIPPAETEARSQEPEISSQKAEDRTPSRRPLISDLRPLAFGDYELLEEIGRGGIAEGPEQMQMAAQNHYLSGIGFFSDGKLFATGSTQGDAMIWDLVNRKPLATLRGHLLGVHAVAFSPDGRRLATASGGREAVKLWDVATL